MSTFKCAELEQSFKNFLQSAIYEVIEMELKSYLSMIYPDSGEYCAFLSSKKGERTKKRYNAVIQNAFQDGFNYALEPRPILIEFKCCGVYACWNTSPDKPIKPADKVTEVSQAENCIALNKAFRLAFPEPDQYYHFHKNKPTNRMLSCLGEQSIISKAWSAGYYGSDCTLNGLLTPHLTNVLYPKSPLQI